MGPQSYGFVTSDLERLARSRFSLSPLVPSFLSTGLPLLILLLRRRKSIFFCSLVVTALIKGG